MITSLEKKIADQDLKTTEMFGAMMDKFEKQEAQMTKLEEKILQLEETSCSEDPLEASKVNTTDEVMFTVNMTSTEQFTFCTTLLPTHVHGNLGLVGGVCQQSPR